MLGSAIMTVRLDYGSAIKTRYVVTEESNQWIIDRNVTKNETLSIQRKFIDPSKDSRINLQYFCMPSYIPLVLIFFSTQLKFL